jgi:Ala-tRNA(Pro) deacylase
MIPETIDRYLREHHPSYEHTNHFRAVAAQRLAAAEHAPGSRVAKPVVVAFDDGRLALAVTAADHKVDLAVLARAASASTARLVPETEFADRFSPCEPGAEPPLGLFGLPIYVDGDLAGEPWLLMRGGTHEDAIRVDTDEWIAEEHAVVVDGLGRLHL